MNLFLRSRRYEIALLITALIATGLHLGVSETVSEASSGLLFLGRMHPLVVHLPIGILLLVALLELASLSKSKQDGLRTALDVVLPVAVLTALGAFVLGLALAQEGGFPAQKLQLHRQLAFATVVLSCGQAAVWSRFRQHPSNGRLWIYRGAMGATLLLLSLASHEGGTLSRGDAYLAKYAPEVLKPLLGGSSSPKEKKESSAPRDPGDEPKLYADALQPVLDEHCVSCHGPEKTKGKLRLDTLEHLMKGGESGDTVIAGNAQESLLISRMKLPESDDEVMPPSGEPAPTPAEVQLLEFWIDRGATAAFRLRDALPPKDTRKVLERALARAHHPVPTATDAPNEPPPSTADNSEHNEDSETREVDTFQDTADFQAEAQSESAVPEQNSEGSMGGFAVLQARCASCHGANKRKGRLRVDSIGALEQGGSSGSAVSWGRPSESLIVQSIRLPLDHSDHMPPKKREQVSAAELRSIEQWIRSRGTQAKSTAAAPPSAASSPAEQRAQPVASNKPFDEERPQEETTQEDEPALDSGFASCAPPSDPLPEGEVWLFDDVVAPLLNEKCATCHSEELASGALKLDSCEGVHRGGNEGPSVAPGTALESRLVQRILLPSDDDEHMPPVDYPQFDDAELALLQRWIDAGATRAITVSRTELPESLQRVSSPTSSDEKGEATVATLPAPLARQGGCAACQIGSTVSGSLVPGVLSLLFGALALGRRRIQLVVRANRQHRRD